jgi:membrane-bound lytic murein transglycosylase B
MRVIVPNSLERWRVRNLVQPEQCVRPMQRHSRWISVGEWRALGLVPVGKPWPADDTLATLVEPDGPGTPAYLTFGNYRALLAYNCSNFYALSVALLSDAIDQPGN